MAGTKGSVFVLGGLPHGEARVTLMAAVGMKVPWQVCPPAQKSAACCLGRAGGTVAALREAAVLRAGLILPARYVVTAALQSRPPNNCSNSNLSK